MIKALLVDALELASLAAFGGFVWSFATAFPH
jgi:hypothetical protein